MEINWKLLCALTMMLALDKIEIRLFYFIYGCFSFLVCSLLVCNILLIFKEA